MATVRPMVRAGRLRSDIEDPGTVVHLTDSAAYCHGKALCGVAPGRRSVGWIEREGPATCPRCIRKRDKAFIEDATRQFRGARVMLDAFNRHFGGEA